MKKHEILKNNHYPMEHDMKKVPIGLVFCINLS